MPHPAPALAVLLLLGCIAPWSLTGCGGGGGAAPPTAPSAVASFSATSALALVNLTWTAPVSTGGSPITTYRVYRGDSAETLTSLLTLSASARSYQDASGDTGVTYHYAVSAANAVGEGPLSTIRSAASLTPSPPGVVAPIQLSLGDGTAAVSWAPPSDDGGSPITGYGIYRGDDADSLTWQTDVGPTDHVYTDDGLTNGTTVYYAVTARNAVDEGPRSDAVSGAPSDTSSFYGLFVGVNAYDTSYISSASWLKGCVNDANGVRNSLLKDSSRWARSSTLTLADAAATKASILESFAFLASVAQPGDSVVYFHSSHGGSHLDTDKKPTTDTFICCYNGAFEDYELATALSAFRSGVQILVVVDACHSGGLFKDDSFLETTVAPLTKSSQSAPRFDLARSVMAKMTPGLSKDTGGPEVAWITAADYDQYSYDGVPYGVFTGHLITGFIASDADTSGLVSALELADYVVPRAVGSATDVQVWNEDLLGTMVLAATGNQPSPDTFESDGTQAEASTIEAGVTQIHTLHTATDQDWVTFTLTGPADIVLETNGVDGWGGDTLLTLYTYTSSLTKVTSNDNGGTGFYSRITRTALAAGTYYVQVKETYGARPIEGYTLDLTVTPAAAP